MPPSEYEALAKKIDGGFEGVHARIGTFKDEFNSHRLACASLFSEIKVSEAIRSGEERGIAKSLKDRVDWGKVKTGVALAVGTLLSIAAIKILILNFDKIAKP